MPTKRRTLTRRSSLICWAARVTAKSGPVIVTRKGKPFAALKALSGHDWEWVALANNPKFLALIEESRNSLAKHGGITLDALRRELGLKHKRMSSRPKKNSAAAKRK